MLLNPTPHPHIQSKKYTTPYLTIWNSYDPPMILPAPSLVNNERSLICVVVVRDSCLRLSFSAKILGENKQTATNINNIYLKLINTTALFKTFFLKFYKYALTLSLPTPKIWQHYPFKIGYIIVHVDEFKNTLSLASIFFPMIIHQMEFGNTYF